MYMGGKGDDQQARKKCPGISDEKKENTPMTVLFFYSKTVI